MSRRTYGQPDCGLATALDVVGERWTLLIARELLLGPQRFTDLAERLVGLSPNLLASRLRHLRDQGVIAQVDLPPPAARTVYELTDIGWGLEPAISALTRWGTRFGSAEGVLCDPRSAAFAMIALQRTPGTNGWTQSTPRTGACRIDVDDMSLSAWVTNGRVRTRAHPPNDPVATATVSTEAYAALLDGSLTWGQAVTRPDVHTGGDLAQLAAIFSFFAPQS